ncbi:MAG: MoxR family ATPase [Planctomycetota bacterium]|nr:MoxR family ATPase [Planctomycetota bacterium]
MLEALSALRDNISRVFLGHPATVDRVIACLLARGHVLIEDVPGVGKTVLATALARSIDCSFARIQLTPDMLPSDILGVSIYDRERGEFLFKRGPIFANIILADEVNRTSPRTQAALLEAMNEGSVSTEGKSYQLEQPFMVVATQNPLEFEGTYPLPENQLDRFLMRLSVGYPSPEDEARVLELRPASHALQDLRPVLHGSDVIELQRRVDQVRIDSSLVRYIVAFTHATRASELIEMGVSPRGSLALAQASRATAMVRGRDYVIPEDITMNILPVCAHRILTRAALGGGDGAARALEQVARTVPSPA